MFLLFDNLLLMSLGMTMYYGKAKHAIKTFTKLGLKCPKNFNPCEFFLKILSKETKFKEKFNFSMSGSNLTRDSLDNYDFIVEDTDEDLENYINLLNSFSEYANERIYLTDIFNIQVNKQNLILDKISIIGEIKLLFYRNILVLRRDIVVFFIRVVLMLSNALLVIFIYFDLPNGDSAVQNRNGCMYYIANSIIQTNLQGNLMILNKEKKVFYKEQDNEMYSITSYFLSKTCVEIPYQAISAVLNFLIIYFACGLNNDSSEKYLMFIISVFLSGYAASSFAICISALVDDKEIMPAVTPIVIFTQSLSAGFFINQSAIPYVFYPFFIYLFLDMRIRRYAITNIQI